DLYTGLSGKPVHILYVLKGDWLKLNLRAHRLQADVFHAGGKTCVNSTNNSSAWINPGYTRKVQRVLAAAQRQGCRRTHPGNVFELDLVKRVSGNLVFSQVREFKAR